MPVVSAEQAFRTACAYCAAGDFTNAENLCRSILSAAPTCVDAAYLLAILAGRHGRHDEANRLLQQAVGHQAFSIRLDGKPPSSPRHAATPHAGLEALLLRGGGRYIELLRSFASCLPQLRQISAGAADSASPHWDNPWIPPLDAIALYALIALKEPRRYVEVGSGNSTKFVRRAIADHRLSTTIVSIDPQPRAEIDALCDVVIRKPLEETDLNLFSKLGAGDVVFIDSSHRCLMNSDVTVFFTEILPTLAPGVTVGIHDIFLPYDYPAEWVGRYYSEQYLLATYLLAASAHCEILLPTYFMSRHAPAQDALSTLRDGLPGVAPMEGGAFWMVIKSA